MLDKALRIILLVAFLFIFFNFLIADILHTQTCVTIDAKPNRSCEQEIAEQAKNCKYAILFWKKVEPSKRDIDTCLRYRQQHESSQEK